MQLTRNLTTYKFGVGVSYDSFHSGVIWADCLLGFDNPSDKDVGLQVDTHNKTHARVRITPRCRENMGMIDSVDLHYCMQGGDYKCDTTLQVTSQCEQDAYVPLSNTEKYSFWLMTSYVGEMEMKRSGDLTFEMGNTQVRKIIIGFVSGVIGLAVLITLCVAMFYIQKKKKQSKEFTPTTIKPSMMTDGTIEPDMSSTESGPENDDTISYLDYNVTKVVSPLLRQVNSALLHGRIGNEGDQNTSGYQFLTDSDIKDSEKVRAAKILEDSDYGTGTDNSGNSMSCPVVTDVYPATSYMAVPHNCIGDDSHGVNGYYRAETIKDANGNAETSFTDTDNTGLSAILHSTSGESSEGPLFKGITLADFMHPSLSEKNRNYSELSDEYMAVTNVVPKKSLSTESVAASIHSGYLQVSRINNNEVDSGLGDYLLVNTTSSPDEKVALIHKPNEVKKPKALRADNSTATGDGNYQQTSDGTFSLLGYELDVSSSSAIDMTQFLDKTTV